MINVIAHIYIYTKKARGRMATQIRDTTNKNSKEFLGRRWNRTAWLFSFVLGGLFGAEIFLLVLVDDFGKSIGFWNSAFVGIAAVVVLSVFCRITVFAGRYNPR